MSIFYETHILIEAKPEKVFDALTDPAKTRLYMFNCEVYCEWKVGDPVLWIGAADEVVYVKGHLLAYEPNKEIIYTVFDPNSDIEDIPENYLTTSLVLEDLDIAILLKVSQGDYDKVAKGEERFQHTDEGWSMALNGLKELVEV